MTKLIEPFVTKSIISEHFDAVSNWSPKKLPSMGIFLGKYCRLEPLDISNHGKKLYQEFTLDNEERIWTFLPFGPFDTYTQFQEQLEKDSKTKLFFSIFDQNFNDPKGIASYRDIDPIHGVIEVASIIFSPSLQKTRAATESMYLMMHYVFEQLQYRRYQWRCNSLNQASRAAAERLGFQFEGIFRQSNVFKGKNRDTAWYSILDSEWPSLKRKFEAWLNENNFDAEGRQLQKLQEID